MEENEVKEVEVEAKEAKKSEITISKDWLGLISSVMSIALLIVLKVLWNFGALLELQAFGGSAGRGIMGIVIYGLAVAGVVLGALRNRRFTQGLWLSIAILAFVLSSNIGF